MIRRSLLSGVFVAWLLSLLPPVAAMAQTLPMPVAREPVRLALIGRDGTSAGLQVRLAPGWKFYWRTPGEGGVPPRFDWSASRNLADIAVEWPAPQRIAIGDVELYGYTGEVLLPINVTPQRRDQPVILDLMLEYGVCKEVCILREDRLTRNLGLRETGTASSGDLLARWRARVPQPAARAGIRLLSRQSAGDRLILTLGSETPLTAPDLFVEGNPEAWYGRPEVTLSPDWRQARFAFEVAPPAAAEPPLTLTLVDGSLAAELQVAK